MPGSPRGIYIKMVSSVGGKHRGPSQSRRRRRYNGRLKNIWRDLKIFTGNLEVVREGDGAAEGGDGAGVLTLVPPLQVLHPQVVATAQAATGDHG